MIAECRMNKILSAVSNTGRKMKTMWYMNKRERLWILQLKQLKEINLWIC